MNATFWFERIEAWDDVIFKVLKLSGVKLFGNENSVRTSGIQTYSLIWINARYGIAVESSE